MALQAARGHAVAVRTWVEQVSPSRLLTWALALWLPAAVVATVLAGTVYGVGQSMLRSGANDPQVQVAEDAAARLSSGASASDVVGTQPVDISSSLAVAVSVVRPDGTILASTARLDGHPARPPLGALRAATPSSPNMVTWQPRPGVRQAAVVVALHGTGGDGAVVASRSLRLVEQRENDVGLLALFGWVAALAAGAVVAVLAAAVLIRREPAFH